MGGLFEWDVYTGGHGCMTRARRVEIELCDVSNRRASESIRWRVARAKSSADEKKIDLT